MPTEKLEKALGEIAEDVTDKRGKLNNLLEAVIVDDMDQIAESERDRVSRYYEEKVFNKNKNTECEQEASCQEREEDMRRTLIVADNITIGQQEKQQQPQQPRQPQPEQPKKKFNILPYVLTAAACLATGSAIPLAAKYFSDKPEVSNPNFVDTDSFVRTEFGFDGDFEVIKPPEKK
jgi:hypothetical protein